MDQLKKVGRIRYVTPDLLFEKEKKRMQDEM